MFTGFSEKSTEFLWGIRFNNSREWFMENKQAFLDHVQAPMKALADDVWTCLTQTNKLDLSYRVARIYRDARRVRDGNLYRDHIWFSLEKQHENWQATPVFFFSIEPEGFTYGLGYYEATAETMKKFRDRLDANPAEFERLASDLKTRGIFEIEGDEYRKKKGEKAGLLAEWYNRKSVAMIANRTGHEALYAPGYAAKLCAEFQTLIPLYRFLWSLDGEQN
jgi:uncharacterized protein (TIGR02453 family)